LPQQLLSEMARVVLPPVSAVRFSSSHLTYVGMRNKAFGMGCGQMHMPLSPIRSMTHVSLCRTHSRIFRRCLLHIMVHSVPQRRWRSFPGQRQRHQRCNRQLLIVEIFLRDRLHLLRGHTSELFDDAVDFSMREARHFHHADFHRLTENRIAPTIDNRRRAISSASA